MELIFNGKKGTLYLNNEKFALTEIQARIMWLLVRYQGKSVSRETIIREIWNDDLRGGARLLDVHLCYLRKKIGDSDHRLIVSIRGNKGEGGFILLRETAPAYL